MFFIMFLSGIAISHAYREILIKFRVLSYPIPAQLVWIAVSSFLKGSLFFLIILVVWHVLGLLRGEEMSMVNVSEYIINFSGIFGLWNVIYFGFQYFQNYKTAEIASLRYLAASRESELNSLKSQLNPHFIFNCMNSIRALIDENPTNAKTAVTRLSNILRNTLQIDKSREIALKDEMNLVKDYLELEKIRFEERLVYEFAIAEEVQSIMIPPFIIQTQVENAIKHGLSKLPGPGTIKVEALKRDGELLIRISNTGKINDQKPLTGVGFKNSMQRLQLLYGVRSRISIREDHNLVIVEIHIPLK